jgi:hypothetical protein
MESREILQQGFQDFTGKHNPINRCKKARSDSIISEKPIKDTDKYKSKKMHQAMKTLSRSGKKTLLKEEIIPECNQLKQDWK